MSKRWNPTWSKLPPVEPVNRSGPAPAPREMPPEERAYRLKQYERTHLAAVLADQDPLTQDEP